MVALLIWRESEASGDALRDKRHSALQRRIQRDMMPIAFAITPYAIDVKIYHIRRWRIGHHYAFLQFILFLLLPGQLSRTQIAAMSWMPAIAFRCYC